VFVRHALLTKYTAPQMDERNFTRQRTMTGASVPTRWQYQMAYRLSCTYMCTDVTIKNLMH